MKWSLPGSKRVTLWIGTVNLFLNMSPTCTQAGTLAARALWLVLLPEETRVLSYPLTSPHLSYIMKLSHSQETARLVRPTAHTQCPGGYRTHGKNTRNIHHISLDHSNYNLCNWIFFFCDTYLYQAQFSQGYLFHINVFLRRFDSLVNFYSMSHC